MSFFTNSSQTDACDRPRATFTELSTRSPISCLTDDKRRRLRHRRPLRCVSPRRATRTRSRSTRVSSARASPMASRGSSRTHVAERPRDRSGRSPAAWSRCDRNALLPEDGRFRGRRVRRPRAERSRRGLRPDVQKFGGYVVFDGEGARRHSVGYVRVGHASVRNGRCDHDEFPADRPEGLHVSGRRVRHPGPGRCGHKGLDLLATPTPGSLPTIDWSSRAPTTAGGRSTCGAERRISCSGRPINQVALDGLLYETLGGRATVKSFRGVRVYAGYSQDRNNRDTDADGSRRWSAATRRTSRGSGVDVSASDSLMRRPTGSYHSRYVSVGRQFGRAVYVSGDYSSSLSLVRFSRSDGITVETKPHTTRISGTGNNQPRSIRLAAPHCGAHSWTIRSASSACSPA